jgi:hypothetical protein
VLGMGRCLEGLTMMGIFIQDGRTKIGFLFGYGPDSLPRKACMQPWMI